MSVNLVKGQKVNLQKNGGGALEKVIVGLGWDEMEQPQQSGGGFLKMLFSAPAAETIDCDASAILCIDNKLRETKDIVYFGHLKHESGAVWHTGDNLTGAGEGDDEQIIVDLPRVPQIYNKIVFVVNIYQAFQKHQHFGMIRNAFIRIVDAGNNQELCRYDLTGSYSQMTAMIFGEIYRYNGQWKFGAIGQGTKDGSIGDLAERYR